MPDTRPEVCVGAIVVDDDRLLLVKRGHAPAEGAWSVPGGRVEAGETVAQSVVRELYEETGLEGMCGALIGWAEVIEPDHHAVILDFSVEVLEARDPVAGSDAAEARWVPLSAVGDFQLAPGLAEFLHEHDVISTIT